MTISIPAGTLEKFTTFGDLLRFLRRRVSLTQMELAEAVGYSDSQISRLEQNLRLPDIPTIQSLFVPALGLENEPKAVARLLDLAANVRREDAPGLGLCPYKGLTYFDEADADLFVGREALTAKLAERVLALALSGSSDQIRFLAVVGASGSGKSSLVRAGLVSVLRWNNRSADWQIYLLTPTAQPLESLATSLTGENNPDRDVIVEELKHDPHGLQMCIKRKFHSRSHPHVLLIVDQLEEIFTLCHSEEEKISFIDNLLTASTESNGHVTVLITLRADFYAHCANYVQLREAVAGNQEYIGAMSTDELRRAIEEPAQRGRWEIEPGLVDLLLHDVGQEPGALPLLSHALLETWQRRRGRTMTLSGYASSGGVRGAIAETAETVFTDQFTREQQAIARRIFVRLTNLSDEISMADTRRRATFDELILKPEETAVTHAVLKSLADARLITTSQDSAEVAHEALIREWPTLRNWLEDDREGLRLHRQMTEAAQEWQVSDRTPDLLYRGVRLAQAQQWAQSHGEDLNPLELEFLNASIALSEQEVYEREMQRQRELDAAKKLAEVEQRRAEEQTLSLQNLRLRNRLITGVSAVAILLAVLVGLFGQQSNRNAAAAEQNAQTALNSQATAQANAESALQAKANAEAQERLAKARELAAHANSSLNIDPEQSLLLAIRGVEVTSPDGFVLPDVNTALHRAIASSRIQESFLSPDGIIWAMTYSPDGTRLATGGSGKLVNIWDIGTFENLLTIKAHDLDVDSISFSPDGRRLASSSDDGTAKIWNAESGELLFQLDGHSGPVVVIAFNPSGTHLATLSADRSIRLWDAADGRQLRVWDDLQDPGYQLVFSPDGKRLIYVDAGQLYSRDSQNGDGILTIPSDYGISLFAQSPDGTRLAIIDDFIRLLDAESGQLLYNIALPGNRIEHIAFSPDGSRLAIAGRDRKVTVMDAANGTVLFQLVGHNQFIFRFTFSPDGSKLFSADQDGIVKVWSLEPTQEVLTIATEGFGGFTLNPDGTRLATIFQDTFQILDAHSGSILIEKNYPDNEFTAISYNPAGTEVATGGTDQFVRIWDATSGELLQEIPVTDPKILAITYSPDEESFAIAGLDGVISIYGHESATPKINWNAGAGQINSLAFSPDGSRLGVGSLDINNAKIFDPDTGEEVLVLKGHANNPVSIAYSQDGTRIVTSGRDSTARLWDAQSGQLLKTLSGHTSTVSAARFSSDGQMVTTAGRDGTVRVWDANTGRNLVTLPVDGAAPNAMFTPNGDHIITWDFTGLKIFSLKIDELVQIAKSRLTRTWRLEECQQFLQADSCPSEN